MATTSKPSAMHLLRSRGQRIGQPAARLRASCEAGGSARGRACDVQRRMRMAALLVAACVLWPGPAPAAGGEPSRPLLRCGWFDNPTPGNAWLIDRDAQWVVGVQGGHQAEGDWPEFRPNEWVSTNRSYGYGCACLRVVADPETHQIQRILSAKPRPVAACKNDPALAKHRPAP